ncbi:MAG: uracil-DNA glycosylase [Proteobacteria bacterium]|nr:uracil-DNA glycosylase [Pseudomonadota bacterium]MBU1640787.1 uracil-DNA glycosylase [Pseudomonadota bacterium]
MTTQSKEELAQELATLTDATRKLCALHGTLGLEYPKSTNFTTRPASPALKRAQAESRALATLAPPPQPPTTKPAPLPIAAHDLSVLIDTISHCERCLPQAKRPTPLFGKGKQICPVLLIVGDAASSGALEHGEIFSGQEGDLLGKMLAAINISVTDVFQTNIVKCAFGPGDIPLATQLQNCRPHLAEQISLLRPLIICTMGQMASQALIGTKNKLIALRGRFHQFNKIPLMATYHPSQLIQVPDLKKAAWYDLQLIQHKLKQIKKA